MWQKVRQRIFTQEGDNFSSELWGDEWIAVAIAADPRTKTNGTRVGRRLNSEFFESISQVIEYFAERSTREVVHVIQRIARFIQYLRLLKPKLIGLP